MFCVKGKSGFFSGGFPNSCQQSGSFTNIYAGWMSVGISCEDILNSELKQKLCDCWYWQSIVILTPAQTTQSDVRWVWVGFFTWSALFISLPAALFLCSLSIAPSNLLMKWCGHLKQKTCQNSGTKINYHILILNSSKAFFNHIF